MSSLFGGFFGPSDAGAPGVANALSYLPALDLPHDAKDSDPLGQALTSRDLEWYAMAPYWRRTADVRGGTQVMRDLAYQAGSTTGSASFNVSHSQDPGYLPKMSSEDDKEYRARINTAFMLDFLQRGVEAYASKPFAEDPQIILPSYLAYITDNMDGLGTDLVQFCKEVFQEVFYNGLVHVMVQRGRDENRPIIKLIHGPSLYSTLADPQAVGGFEYARYCETLKKGSAAIQGVRQGVQDTGIWSVDPTGGTRWVQQERMSGRGWARDDEFTFPRGAAFEGQVPLASAYAIRRGLSLAASGFWPVVDLSIKHFRAQSEHEYLLRAMRFPVTGIFDAELEPSSQSSGADGAVNTIADSSIMQLRSNHQEFPGRSEPINDVDASKVDSSADNVRSLEEQMAVRTVAMLISHPSGDETATAKAIDTAEETSELSSAVTNVENMLEKILYFAASTINGAVVPGEIDVTFDRTFGFQSSLDVRKEVDAMMSASKQRQTETNTGEQNGEE